MTGHDCHPTCNAPPDEVLPPLAADVSPPAYRVRAVMHDDMIHVNLADLIGYVQLAEGTVDEPCRQLIGCLLQRLGEALESE